MPSTYTGSGDDVELHGPVEIQCPVDSDPFGASTINAPLQQLANIVQFLQDHAALRGSLETAVFEGQPSDTSAALQLSGVIVDTRKLEIEAGTTVKTRLYVQPSSAFEFTTNAMWNGTNWVRDEAGDSSRLSVDPNGVLRLSVHAAASASPWADSAWVAKVNFGSDDRLVFTGTTATASGSNPPAATPIVNEVRAKNVCKAFGRIVGLGGTGQPAGLMDGINVASVARVGTCTIRVTFAAPMADDKYSAQVAASPYNGGPRHVYPTVYATDYFDITLFDANATTNTDYSAAAIDITFSVFGRQDS